MTEQKDARELRIGFIGVVVMVRPMVQNLLKANFPCTIYDVNPKAVDALAVEGATAAGSAVKAGTT